MKIISQHLTKCIIAGIVAILPIGGSIIIIGYLETMISDAGISKIPFYFPGMGILMTIIGIYIIGLTVTTFIGRWAWEKIDKLINRLPALGKLYLSIKEILGYGEGEDAFFQNTVLIPAQGGIGEELGLVTNEIFLPDKTRKLVVFVPGSPNPTVGRLIILDADDVTPVNMQANDTLKALVSIGKTEFSIA
ncbi:DUF502 domain-containing protein [bacterium AH-315-E10]|nr:DUF502 domain-containing protein [bacterium AH-315-E10]